MHLWTRGRAENRSNSCRVPSLKSSRAGGDVGDVVGRAPSNGRVVRDVSRTVSLRPRVCLRSLHLKRTRQNGRYSTAGVRSCFRGDILVSRSAHAAKLLAGLQTMVPVPQ